MVMFSKFFFGECTKFLFILVAFWSFNDNCFARNNVSSKENKSEVEVIVQESKSETETIIPKSNNAKTRKNNSKKLTETSSPKKVKPETEQEHKSEELTEASSPKEDKPKTEKEYDSEKLIETLSPKEDKAEARQSKEKSSDNSIVEFMRSLFGPKPLLEDHPGCWKKLPDFDLEITCIEANDEFPSGSFRLKDLKGNVVILFFTSPWCPNCVKVFQDLDNLNKGLSGKNISNVKIITLVLGTEDDDTVKNYYEANNVKSLCKFRSISPLFFNKVRAVPTCFVFNKKSVPVWGFSGAANYGNFEFLNFIEDLSKEDVK